MTTDVIKKSPIDDFATSASSETDIIYAIKELFNTRDIDVRTRITYKGLRAHATINYLKDIVLKESKENLCVIEGLDEFSNYIKKLLISLDGKSREEMVNIFKNDLANNMAQGGSFNMFGFGKDGQR